jgi:hypothetical protein
MGEVSEKELLPESVVYRYYEAMAAGDLQRVKAHMVPSAYRMTLEAYGLQVAFRDPEFKSLLERSEEEPSALSRVERILSEVLRNKKRKPRIVWLETEVTGSDRRTVHYKEDGNPKKLYFSRTDRGWKIDYMAGRRR